MQNLTSALRDDPVWTLTEILSLKQEAQGLLRQWLFSHCREVLLEFAAQKKPPSREVLKELVVVGESLVKIHSTDINAHLVYADLLAADGK